MTDWIGWGGGECPVHPKTMVETLDREGLASYGPASGWSKENWEHAGERNDYIVAYRVLSKAEETSPNDHYRQGEIECIDAIRAALTDEEWRGFCKGNVLKYVWREKHKGGNDTLVKAEDYLRWARAGKAEGKR